MKIELTDQLKTDLRGFKSYIDAWSFENVNNNQEYILSSLNILINPIFRDQIDNWRQTFSIDPVERSSSLVDVYQSWALHHQLNPPYDPDDERIINFCKSLNVKSTMYANFILNYLYLAEVMPVTSSVLKTLLDFNPYGHYPLNDEFRYKTKLVKDHGDLSIGNLTDITDDPQHVYIEIFKDTSQSSLINFVKKNWISITKFQKNLKPYPHTKNFDYFKRDIQIYLLHLLGYKTKDILRVVYEENVNDYQGESLDEIEKVYSLDEDRIYQIVSDIDQKLKIKASKDSH